MPEVKTSRRKRTRELSNTARVTSLANGCSHHFLLQSPGLVSMDVGLQVLPSRVSLEGVLSMWD